jgi:predicted ATPase/DNA-binding SARP family transcriptional activator
MGETVHLRLLGPVQVERAGEPVRGFESRKALALLCYLAVHEHPVPRSRLAALFWGNKPEARGRANLSRVLHNISTLLPGCFQADRRTVQFQHNAQLWLDVAAFDDLVAQDGPAALATAVGLYRGDFMEGLYLDDCPEFEIWMVGEQERWQRRAIWVLQALTTHHAHRGEYAEGLRFASRLLALAPWREEAHRQMMLLLVHSGQRSAALLQYETCCRSLIEELGIEPQEETTALYHRIRDAYAQIVGEEAGSPGWMRARLPFVGRGKEHARLIRCWTVSRQGETGLTLIAGEAGVGKTRLAREVLRCVAAEGAKVLSGRCYEFEGEVGYQPVAEALRMALPPADPVWDALSPVWRAELAHLLPELRESPASSQARGSAEGEAARQRFFEAMAALLRALVASSRSVVLFLDDLHWADTATLDMLRYLVRRLCDVSVWFLGTYCPEATPLDHPLTRLQHGLGRDRLATCQQLGLLTFEAVQCLVAALVGEKDVPTLSNFLYRQSEGNPFVLTEVIAALKERKVLQLEGEGRARLVEELPHQRFLLTEGIQSFIMQRVGQLPSAAQRLLALGAVVGHTFSQAFLEEAAGADQRHVPRGLRLWQERHFVRPVARDASEPRYEFTHEMIRQTVYQYLSSDERRLLHGQVAAAMERAYHGQEERVVEALAHHYERSRVPERALPYLLQAGERMQAMYAMEAAAEFYTRAMRLVPLTDRIVRYHVLALRERVYHTVANREAQEEDLAELWTLAQALEDEGKQAEVLYRRAEWAMRTARFEEGIAYARRARDLDQFDLAARGLQVEAMCHFRRGDYEQSQACCERGLRLCREKGDQRGEATCLRTLGIVDLTHGNLALAQEHMEAALAFYQVIEDPWQLAIACNNLSMLYHRLGEYGRALEVQMEARRLIPQVGDLALDAHSLTSLGILYHAVGRYEEALACYREAVALAHVVSDRNIEGYILLCRGDTLYALGEVEQAEETYHHAFRIQEERQAMANRVEIVEGLARCRLARGDDEGALALLEDAERLYQEMEQEGISGTLALRARIYLAQGAEEAALRTLTRFGEVVVKEGEPECLEPEEWWMVSKVQRGLGKQEAAREALEQAHGGVQQRATSLKDPEARQQYLAGDPERRAILQAWDTEHRVKHPSRFGED